MHLSKPLPEIEVPGKTRAAINNQRKRLQRAGVLNGSFAGRAVKPWTFPELKRLTALTQDYGFSASFIAQMGLLPGRTKDSVSKMMGRHGLGDPTIKERARHACRFDRRRREEFQRFLVGEGRMLPSMAIARQWGLAQKTVTAYRRRLGIQLSWREARSSEDFRRQQRKRAAAFVAHTRERWAQLARAQEGGMGKAAAATRAASRLPASARVPVLRGTMVRGAGVLSRAHAAFVGGSEGQLLPGLPAMPRRAAAQPVCRSSCNADQRGS